MTQKELKEYRDQHPFKAILPGQATERFSSLEDALSFYNYHKGTCLLSKCDSSGNQIIGYKHARFK